MPESALIRQEHIVRDMQLLGEVKLTRRGLIRYLCLSLGLISPNESRTLMLDIIEALLKAHFAQEEPDIHRIMVLINSIRPKDDPAQIKAVRYHLHQLKEKGMLSRKAGKYRFVLPPMAENDDLGGALEYLYVTNTKNAFEKVKKAVSTLKTMY
jgi:transcriptional regulator with GAF, ATPase, and Fis domain